MHQPAHAVAVLVLGDHQPRVPGGDAQLQRGLHVLRQVDRDHRRDRRHHLARLLLVQVEHAGEHARLAHVEMPAGVGLGDQSLELIRRAAAAFEVHVHAHQPEDPSGDGRQPEDERPEHHAERLQWTGDASRDQLGAIDGVELGHHLPGDQLRRGDHQVGHDHGDDHRQAVADDVAEPAFEDGRQRGLAEGADADRGHRHPDLHGRDVLVDVAQLLQRERRPARAFLAHDLQSRPARTHERVLGDHEKRVHRDQHRREDELEAVHASRSIAAASSKSASVRPPAEWVEHVRRTRL